MSDVLNNIIEGAAVPEITERLTAPFLDRPTPSGAQSRPIPSPSSAAAPSFPTPFRRSEQGAGALDSGTASSMGMGVDPTIGSDDGVFKLGAEDIQISTIKQASAADIKNMKGSYLDKAAGKIFGFEQVYNKVTGTIDTKAPNFGLFGAPPVFGVLAAASSKFIQNKQDVAAKNAAAGMKNNGIVQINGMTVAVVDGKLYGNLPQGASYHDVKKLALDYINQNNPNDFAGTYARPAITASDPGFDPDGRSARGYSSGDDNESDGGYSPGGTGAGRSDYQGGYSGFNDRSSTPTPADSYSGRGPGGEFGMAVGGMAGSMQPPQQGIQPAGFVQGPPQQFSDGETVADDQPMQVQEGTFVINAPAVEFAGSDDIRRMILDAYSIAREKGLDIGNVDRTIYEESVDVALSKGEVIVPPALVKIIGLDRLQKINNRGKREVSRRQKEAAEGGFIDGYAEGDLVEPFDYEDPSPEFVKKLSEFGAKKRKRGEIKEFIRSLTPQEAYTVLFLTETSSNSESMQNMENIGYVVRNRIESDYADFKNVNNVYDALLQQTDKGAFQFSGLEPSVMYDRLREVDKGLANLGLRKATSASSNVTDTEPDREGYSPIPFNALFYTKPSAGNQWMRNAKNLEYLMESGGHEFYGPFASPEGFQ